ncbi:pyrroloquinoline quinone-dependent dehydrogenase [Pseudohongiella spirulinae]|uniref:Quinoprotein glucose dehydrogenase n=1 Tax=Pseudohongiella spirulinae TaxID=1249552 RepID=A0A0S2KBX5_9GAMM|nr:pyrroloquinoline quinone-dependent dehydrogenase [Pseudohongiella spirulinae]ALO45789.1 Quinoprotein glucose dehydrogenase [Pseudohongiella spirulinae]
MMTLKNTLFSLILLALAGSAATNIHAQQWDRYGGPGGQQFTPLTDISRDNLSRLSLAWTYRTGDLNAGFDYKGHSFQANPMIWRETLYLSTSANEVLAVDAETGEERWRFDAGIPRDIPYSESASRGVSIWHGESATCPHRIFLGTLTGYVHALNAETGEPCADFGVGGRVDMRTGVGDHDNLAGYYGITSPPAVAGDALIVGSAIGDNREVSSPRGIVRSLDARSGTVNWVWDPLPVGFAGSANVWAPMSVDVERGLAFLSTSSPSPDFYGGERPGDNRYANSVVALAVASGDVVWHQQLVHHDIWDYDLPAQPVLTTLEHNGQELDAVVVVTKTGMMYTFNRANGAPIHPIVERSVPASDVPGEQAWPTQPFSSLPPLVEHRALTEDDAFGIAWFDRRSCQRIIRESRNEGIFTPPSLQGTLLYPSYAGGSNWGGVAVDAQRQIAVANVNQVPAIVRLIPREELAALRSRGDLDGWQVSSQSGTPYVMARRIFMSPLGLPCTRPPWGKLVAMDLRASEILWDVPLGTIRDLAPAPVPNFAWGVPNMGGPLITASGLIVIGAAAEHSLRIFDLMTGEQLWEYRLPAPAMATPMSYELDGVQYIAVAVGGHGQLDTVMGDYVMAFRLE